MLEEAYTTEHWLVRIYKVRLLLNVWVSSFCCVPLYFVTTAIIVTSGNSNNLISWLKQRLIEMWNQPFNSFELIVHKRWLVVEWRKGTWAKITGCLYSKLCLNMTCVLFLGERSGQPGTFKDIKMSRNEFSLWHTALKAFPCGQKMSLRILFILLFRGRKLDRWFFLFVF